MGPREEAEARVARGAALLDERAPGKLKSIDWTQVYLSSCTFCVLGRIYGHVRVGRETLALTSEDMDYYGFSDSLPGGVLGETWRILIAKRNGVRYT